MKNELLRIENGKKDTLLTRICLQVFEGEITGLIFDNVQEKQQFLKIMSGHDRFDYVKVSYQENPVTEEEAGRIFREKTAVISRDSNLIDTVTIGENMFLIRSKVRGQWVHNRRYRKEAAKLFREFGIDMNLNKNIADMTVFEHMEIEIMKAFLLGKRILFLTAFSNYLKDWEKAALWEMMFQLKGRGVSFVVTEPLEDLELDASDAVAVVKRGKTCAVKSPETCDYTTLHTILYRDEMLKNLENWRTMKQQERIPEAVRFSGLRSEYIDGLSLSIQKGEIVKIFCMDEATYEEMIAVLKGKKEILGGSILYRGQIWKRKRFLNGVQDGLGIVEGNPASLSVFEEMTAMDNLCLPLSRKMQGMWVLPKYQKSVRLQLKGILEDEVFDRPIKDLEPFEIQKIIYCKWLLYAPELLICIQPFAEGDIRAREAAREMIYLLEDRKIPVLILTSNTAELNYCKGREVYLKNGRMIEKKEIYES